MHDGLLDVAWFWMRNLGGLLAGDVCKFCGESASALRSRRVCDGGLIRGTTIHYIKSIRMFEEDEMLPEHTIVLQGRSLGGFVIQGFTLKNVSLLLAVTEF